jgi:hypothetical protein
MVATSHDFILSLPALYFLKWLLRLHIFFGTVLGRRQIFHALDKIDSFARLEEDQYM